MYISIMLQELCLFHMKLIFVDAFYPFFYYCIDNIEVWHFY